MSGSVDALYTSLLAQAQQTMSYAQPMGAQQQPVSQSAFDIQSKLEQAQLLANLQALVLQQQAAAQQKQQAAAMLGAAAGRFPLHPNNFPASSARKTPTPPPPRPPQGPVPAWNQRAGRVPPPPPKKWDRPSQWRRQWRPTTTSAFGASPRRPRQATPSLPPRHPAPLCTSHLPLPRPRRAFHPAPLVAILWTSCLTSGNTSEQPVHSWHHCTCVLRPLYVVDDLDFFYRARSCCGVLMSRVFHYFCVWECAGVPTGTRHC